MSRLRIITSVEMCRLLETLGFEAIRQKGSHKFFRHEDGRTTVIPMHARDLDRSLIRKILSDIAVTVDDYNSMF